MSENGFRGLRSRLNLIVLPPLLIVFPIPLGTTVPLRRKPVVTNALVWINIFIFILTRYSGHFEEILLEFGYTAVDDRLPTLFTHIFLHGGYLHVLGNMLFLWIFGANVEDRMGRLGYLLFYLAAGVAAAYTFAYTSGPAMSGMPVVGASGAVYGVMGAFLMLYPLEEIRFTIVVMVLVFFWRFYTIPIAALFIAPLYFLFNLLLSPVRDVLSVGVMAHVGGFLFAVPVGLLHRRLHPGPKRTPAPEIHLEEPAAKPKPDRSGSCMTFGRRSDSRPPAGYRPVPGGRGAIRIPAFVRSGPPAPGGNHGRRGGISLGGGGLPENRPRKGCRGKPAGQGRDGIGEALPGTLWRRSPRSQNLSPTVGKIPLRASIERRPAHLVRTGTQGVSAAP
jgi:membrane associated rhomboid family serine protease